MAYHIYTTKGITLGSEPAREADRLYSILTEDLGLIRARAIGVRKERSKLRGMLEPFSLVTVSLVRGQEQWRITNAALEMSLSAELRGAPELAIFARVFSLLEKLVVGEEKHPELYRVLEEAVRYVFTERTAQTAADAFEALVVARMLWELGYVSASDFPKEYFDGRLTNDLLTRAESDKSKLVEAINSGLRQSHLV